MNTCFSPSKLLALFIFVIPGAALAGSHDLTVEMAQPTTLDERTFFVAREAGDLAGDPFRFKVKGDLWVRNNGRATLNVETIGISFPNSGLPSSAAVPLKDQSLPAGGVGRMAFQFNHNIDLAEPVPASVAITLHFSNDPEPATFVYPLAVYENDTPSGSHFFPMVESDLDPGLYWQYWDRHVNGSTGRDRYAYDLVVVRWNGSWYTDRESGSTGNSNADYLAFGMPVYAVSDGQVVRCTRGQPDQTPGDVGSGGGNELWIQHGDEVVRYSHFRADTVPASLCPSSGVVESMNIVVKAGDQLGEIGNSGQTSSPHLHISIHYRPDTTIPLNTNFDTSDSRPLNWHNIDIASSTTDSVNSLGASPTFHAMAGAILPSHSLIRANPCGLIFPAKGKSEISWLNIRAECYQDIFNLSVAQGYAPTFVDGYAIGSDRFFNGVFRPPVYKWESRHDLLLSDLGMLFDDLTSQGYRLHQIDSYPMPNGSGQPDIGHAAIFQQRGGPAYKAYFGLNEADFGVRLDRDGTAGYIPINASATEVSGNTFWSLLMERRGVTSWGLETVPAPDFPTTADFHEDLSEKPTYVHGFRADGVDWLTGIWMRPQFGFVADAWNQALVPFFLEDALQRSNGRFNQAMTGYDDGFGNALFAGVWRGFAKGFITAAPVATSALTTTIEFLADPMASTRCSLNGAEFAACESPMEVELANEGAYRLDIRVVDRDGSYGDTETAHWTVNRDVLSADSFEYGLPDLASRQAAGSLD